MKIVCDSCGAKYSIADEKVAGKVFKIRCKKCSAVIVVRGDQVGDAPAEASAMASGPEPTWHVVVGGDQQGPYTDAQVGEMLTAGTIDWDAYVWREGFEGWVAAREVPELVRALSNEGDEEDEATTAGVVPAAAAMAAGSASADPFAASAADDGGMFGGGADESPFGGADQGGDLFGGQAQDASPFGAGADDDVVASTPQPAAASPFGGGGGGGGSMTGQRNENSVLFSLSNLQALATGGDGGSTSPSTSSAPSSPPMSGHAIGEGSGLIDIRALASTTGIGGGGPAAVAKSEDRVDDLLSLGTGGAGVGGLGAPVLAPVQEEKDSKQAVYLMAGVGALAAAAVLIVGFVFLSGSKDDSAAIAAAPPAAAAAGAIQPGAGAAGAIAPAAPAANSANPAPTPTGSSAEPAAAPTAAPEPEPEADEDESGSSRRSARNRSRRSSRSGGSSASSSNESSMASAPAPSRPSMRGGNDLDSLLAGAIGGGSKMRNTSSGGGGGGNLQDRPSRNDVLQALNKVKSAVSACGGGQSGVATTAITVSGSNGRVTSANVSGPFAGTPVGSCVARAVRRARFPKFKQSTFSVTFPFRI